MNFPAVSILKIRIPTDKLYSCGPINLRELTR
jgi:hypothetical protein